MIRLVVILALIAAPLHPYERGPSLLFENSKSKHFSDKKGVIELKGGSGWLRTPHAYVDFELDLSFRVVEPNTDAGVVVRTPVDETGWPGNGYRLTLPPGGAPLSFTDSGRLLTTVSAPTEATRPLGEWQQLRVVAHGSRVGVFLNGVASGVYETERSSGYVIFTVKKGRVEFRQIDVKAIPVPLPDGVFGYKSPGLELPQIISDKKPAYTREMFEAPAQGSVDIEGVVLTDGSFGSLRVKRSDHFTFDRPAIDAARQWRFKPGVHGGKPVPVMLEIEMTFSRRPPPP